jgi:uncharacterized protein YkwD
MPVQLPANLADGVILLLLFLGLSRGWSRGALNILADLIGLLGGLLAALSFYPSLAEALATLGLAPPLTRPLAFVLIWIGIHVLVGLVLAALLARIPAVAGRSLPNRLIGAVLGFGKWALYVGLVVLLLTVSPGLASVKAQVGGSRYAPLLIQPARSAATWVLETFGDPVSTVIGDLAELLTVRPPVEEEDPGRISLGFQVQDVRPDPAAEQSMLDLVNEERVSRGLHPLVMDERLREAARAHSRDMLARGYFNHVTPDGVTPARRLLRERISFLTMGENLAFAPTLQVAHQGLMRSPGHRANILRPVFTRVGIGVINAGIYGRMFTQEFAN